MNIIIIDPVDHEVATPARLDLIIMPVTPGCGEQHLCSLATIVAKSGDQGHKVFVSVIICLCGTPMLQVCLSLYLGGDLSLIFLIIMLPKLAIEDCVMTERLRNCRSINYDDCIMAERLPNNSGTDNNMQKLIT